MRACRVGFGFIYWGFIRVYRVSVGFVGVELCLFN